MYKILYANVFQHKTDSTKMRCYALVKSNNDYFNIGLELLNTGDDTLLWSFDDDTYNNEIPELDMNKMDDIELFSNLIHDTEPYICHSKDYEIIDIIYEENNLKVAFCDVKGNFHKATVKLNAELDITSTYNFSKEDFKDFIKRAMDFVNKMEG